MKIQSAEDRTHAHGVNTRVEIVPNVDWRQAMRDIVALLAVDEHVCDDDTYECFLGSRYAGCTSCRAAMVARAALDDKPYPPYPPEARKE